MKVACSVALLFVLAGCGSTDDNTSIAHSRRCTDVTADTFNTLILTQKTYELSGSDSDLKNVQKYCVQLKNLVGESSCMANLYSADEFVMVSKKKVDPICTKAERLLKKTAH